MRKLLLYISLIAPLFAQNPVTSPFPGANDTDQTLSVEKNNVTSTLSAGIDAITTSIPVATGTGSRFLIGQIITIGFTALGEKCQITAISSDTLTCASRGQFGTSPATATFGALVSQFHEAYSHNALAAAIKAIETNGVAGTVDANSMSHAWAMTDGGTTNAITGTTTTTFPVAYASGQGIVVKMANTNTGATTINVHSLGVKSVTKNGAAALAAGDLVVGREYVMVYDGTQFQVLNYTFTTGGTPSGNVVTFDANGHFIDGGSTLSGVISSIGTRAGTGACGSGAVVTGINTGTPTCAAPIVLTTSGTSGAATYSGGTLNIPSYTGGGGGATLPFAPSITSSTVGNIACAGPCNFLAGYPPVSSTLNSPGNITLTSGSAGSIYVWGSAGGALTAGRTSGLTISCDSGCTAVGTVTGFPIDGFPIAIYTVTSSILASVADKRAPFTASPAFTWVPPLGLDGGGNATCTGCAPVATGIAAMGTTSIAANSCAAVVTVSATGTTTSNLVAFAPSADISGATGYSFTSTDGLKIYQYPTANNVNFKVCNGTGSAITPGAVTLNWRVLP